MYTYFIVVYYVHYLQNHPHNSPLIMHSQYTTSPYHSTLALVLVLVFSFHLTYYLGRLAKSKAIKC